MENLRAADPSDEEDSAPPRSILELHVPVATILKVLVAAVLVWAALKLLPDFFFFLLAILLALSLTPLVQKLERRIPRGWAVALVALAVVVTLAALVVFIGPPLVSQMVDLVGRVPDFRGRLESHYGSHHPLARRLLEEVLALPSSPELLSRFKPIAWGPTAIAAITVAVLVVTLTLYLVADGKRTYAWLLAYVPRRHRKRRRR